jgi:H+/Cl- antiporter ClcA
MNEEGSTKESTMESEKNEIYREKMNFKNKFINILLWTLFGIGLIFISSEIALFIYLFSQTNWCWQQISFQIAWLIFFLALTGFFLLAIVKITKEE